jgi:hypothetical protein
MGACTQCGGSGQPCCDGNNCSNGGCCIQAVVGSTCVAAQAMCPGMQGACSAGGCQGGACGKTGEPCCVGDVCTAPLTTCRTMQCAACGGAGQPCCPEFGRGGGGGGYCTTGLACDGNDTCAQCGASGQPCCPGDMCTSGTCANGRCG